jgi:hypothetical protein
MAMWFFNRVRSNALESAEPSVDMCSSTFKERALADVERRYPAERYVMVDDKLRILAATK